MPDRLLSWQKFGRKWLSLGLVNGKILKMVRESKKVYGGSGGARSRFRADVVPRRTA